MATNIEMNLLKDNGSYEVLYPKTDYNGLVNKPSIPNVSNFVTTSQMNNSLSSYVPTYRTVNGKSLSSNVDIKAKDISDFANGYIDVSVQEITVSNSAVTITLGLSFVFIGVMFFCQKLSSGTISISSTTDFSSYISATNLMAYVMNFYTGVSNNVIISSGTDSTITNFPLKNKMYAKNSTSDSNTLTMVTFHYSL